jgi:cardiolipin hydrolase
VIDNEVLLNGSFNWTRHAVLGNQENVVVYRDPMLCRKFVAEFERLWLKFAASRNRV